MHAGRGLLCEIFLTPAGFVLCAVKNILSGARICVKRPIRQYTGTADPGREIWLCRLLADENGVSIKVAKYAGTDKVELIENEEYGYCSLIKATNQVLERLRIENVTKTRVTSTRRVEQNLVEPVALREAVVNAIVHNDYTVEIPPVFEIFRDRIEIASYGGLIPGQSEEDFFGCCSMPRNRELMHVFKNIGLVEQLGSGMSRILRSYGRSCFEITDHKIKVTFAFPIKNTVNIAIGDDRGDESRVLDAIRENPSVTAKQLHAQLGISERRISCIVQSLKLTGRVIRIGSDRKGYWEVQE